MQIECDADTLATIKAQTSITDDDTIKIAYARNAGDMVQTIIDLMSIKDVSPPPKPRTYVHEVREILAEKEQLFKQYCDSQKCTVKQ